MQASNTHDVRAPVGAIWLAVFLLLTLAYLLWTSEPLDLRADRLVTLAAWDGLDPYVPVVELADRYGSALDWTHVHPRTPGALIMQSPLVLVPESALRALSAVGTAGMITAIGLLVARLVPGRRYAGPLTALVVGISSVAFESATVGAQSPLLAVLLGLGWLRLRNEDDVVGGTAVGIAVTLKVFPWVILPAIVNRRPRAVVAGGIVFAFMNGLGLLFPGVTVQGSVQAVASANLSRSADLNGSLVRLFDSAPVEVVTWVLASVGVLVAYFVNRSDLAFDQRWVLGMVAAMVVSPLLWRHYLLTLVPVAAWLAVRGAIWAKIAVGVGIGWLILPDPLIGVRLAVPVSLGLGLAALSTRRKAVDDGAVQVD